MAGTIAFTLPISCQICLGRVKEPVVCSNQHVFCKTCIELWLEKNHQCPTCRISISQENPCRPVLGGLNPEAGPERGENFSNRELRRARMELIFKDYENEIDRLEAELEFEKHRADELTMQVRGHVPEDTVSIEPRSTWDYNAAMILRIKVQDLTALNNSLKTEMAKIKKDLAEHREENALLLRENQRMRLDLANRSPRRFGRFTVAALENKLATSEKEVEQLKKALENSDLYIEELEKQLAMRHLDAVTTNRLETAGKSIKGSQSDIENNSELSANSSSISSSDFHVEMVKVGTSQADEMPSFVLEVPSMDTTLSEQSLLQTADGNADGEEIKECHKAENFLSPAAASFSFELPSSSISNVSSSRSSWQMGKEPLTKNGLVSRSSVCRDELQATSPRQTVNSCKKRLRFAPPNDHFANPARKSLFGEWGPNASLSNKLGNATIGHLSNSSQFYGSNMAESSQLNGQMFDNQNSTVAPEVEDCLKLMDAMERKVKERTSESSGLFHNSAALTSNRFCSQSALTSQPLFVSRASAGLGETNGMTSCDLRPEGRLLLSDSSEY